MESTMHKRKASTEAGETIGSATAKATDSKGDAQRGEEQEKHTTKKAKTDGREGHAGDCQDPDCEGCAEGEIVLQFDGETRPSAIELFRMAREEASKESEEGQQGGSHGSGGGMAKKLFDLALEEFEKDEKAKAHLDLEGLDQEAGKVLLEEKVQHAACLVAVGNFMPSLGMVQEGVSRFKDLVRMEKAGGSGNVLVGQGIAEISEARLLRKEALEKANENSDDEEEEDEEAMRAAAIVPKTEKALVKHALEAFSRGLGLLKADPKSTFAEESIRATQELEEYGVSVDIQLNSELATAVFDQALEHIENARAVKPELIDNNADVLSLYGSCIFSKARLVNHRGDEAESKTLLDKAIETLVKAEEMQDEEGDAKTLEALGQAYLMSTILTEEEDLIMEAYDAATERLTRALELNPNNAALRKQLDAMQAEDEDFGEGEGPEGSDDEDPEDQEDDEA